MAKSITFQGHQNTFFKGSFFFTENNKVSVRNTANTPAGSFDEICGYADIPNPETAPAELLVHFPFAPAADYWVLETDYDNFASVYACVDVLGIIHIEFAWVLVRDPQNVTYELMEQALNAYKTQGLSVDNFLPVSHENCGDYENPSGAEVCSGGGWGK